MIFSSYSLFTTTLLISMFMLMFIFVTGFNNIVLRIPLWVVYLSLAIMGLRLLIPIEIDTLSVEINSYDIMAKFNDFLEYKVFDFKSFSVTVDIMLYIIWGLGTIMSRHYATTQQNSKRNIYFTCDYGTLQGCCKEKIYIEPLKKMVTDILTAQIQIVIADFEVLKKNISSEMQITDEAIKRITSDLNLCQKQNSLLYTDYKNGIFTMECLYYCCIYFENLQKKFNCHNPS